MTTPNINDLRRLVAEQELPWQVDETAVSRLPEAVQKTILGDSYRSPEDLAAIQRERLTPSAPLELAEPLPSFVDWRNKGAGKGGGNWITAVKNQGLEPTCAAFAAVAVLESHLHIASNRPVTRGGVDFSEAYLYFWIGEDTHDPNGGWTLRDAFEVNRRFGTVREAIYPYNGPRNRPDLSPATPYGAIKGYYTLMTPSAMKHYLAIHGPLAADMNTYIDLTFYSSGVYVPAWTFWPTGMHGVCVVGYCDDSSLKQGGYWICKNSWGDGWGEKGFFRIAYGECSIDDVMYAVDGAEVLRRPPQVHVYSASAAAPYAITCDQQDKKFTGRWRTGGLLDTDVISGPDAGPAGPERSDTIAWLAGEFTTDGHTEIAQVWRNNAAGTNRGALTVLRMDEMTIHVPPKDWETHTFQHVSRVFQADTGEGVNPSGTIPPQPWLTGDFTGRGRTEIAQVWSRNDTVAVIGYRVDTAAGELEKFTGFSGHPVAAVAWLTGDFTGCGHDQIAQVRNISGHVGLTVFQLYGPGAGMESPAVFESPGTAMVFEAWRAGNFSGDSGDRKEIVQIYSAGGKMGVTAYRFEGNEASIFAQDSSDQHSINAVAWLTGDFTGCGLTQIAQVFNNNNSCGASLFARWP